MGGRELRHSVPFCSVRFCYSSGFRWCLCLVWNCAIIQGGFIQNWNICWVSLWKLYTPCGVPSARIPAPRSRMFNMAFPSPRFPSSGPLGSLSEHPLSAVTVPGCLNLFLWHRVPRSTCSQQTGKSKAAKERPSSPLWGSFQFQFRSKLKLEQCPVLRIRTVVCCTLSLQCRALLTLSRSKLVNSPADCQCFSHFNVLLVYYSNFSPSGVLNWIRELLLNITNVCYFRDIKWKHPIGRSSQVSHLKWLIVTNKLFSLWNIIKYMFIPQFPLYILPTS